MRVPSFESVRENSGMVKKTCLWGEVHLKMEKEPDHYYSYYRLYVKGHYVVLNVLQLRELFRHLL
jgi:hypothetical protein